MPRVRLLWATGKQTIQYVDDSTVERLPVETAEGESAFLALNDFDDEALPVYKEEPSITE